MGEWNQLEKTGEAPYTDADPCVFRPRVRIAKGPSVEKICDHFAFLAPENYVDQPPVVFGVSEREGGRFTLIEATKAKFQTDEEKALPVLKFLAVHVYRRTPLIRNLRQAQGSGFQPGQVA